METPEVEQEDEFQKEEEPEETELQMAGNILKLALPCTVGLIVEILQQNINLIFVGRLNKPSVVAGVGIGNMVANIFSWSIMCGLNVALETLVSQAYGAKDLKLCGVYLNRARIVCIATFIPSTLIVMNTERLLLLLH